MADRAPEEILHEFADAVGHSAGANLVALAAAAADDPSLKPGRYPGLSSERSAVVGYSGIYDFRAAGADQHADYLGGIPEQLSAAYDRTAEFLGRHLGAGGVAEIPLGPGPADGANSGPPGGGFRREQGPVSKG